MEYPKDCNTKDFQCTYPSCMCGNVETQPPQPTIGLTYEQLEQLYFTQCECTDEWADKYKLSQEENEKLIHDLSEYISIANISTTQLAQAQAEKAELVRQCALDATLTTPPDTQAEHKFIMDMYFSYDELDLTVKDTDSIYLKGVKQLIKVIKDEQADTQAELERLRSIQRTDNSRVIADMQQMLDKAREALQKICDVQKMVEMTTVSDSYQIAQQALKDIS